MHFVRSEFKPERSHSAAVSNLSVINGAVVIDAVSFTFCLVFLIFALFSCLILDTFTSDLFEALHHRL